MGGPQNDAAGPGGSARDEPLNAPLFRSLVERLQEGERAVILDLGPAQPATISLFSQFRCRLDIADIAEGGNHVYRSSKAAANAVMRGLSFEPG